MKLKKGDIVTCNNSNTNCTCEFCTAKKLVIQTIVDDKSFFCSILGKKTTDTEMFDSKELTKLNKSWKTEITGG